jgi:hypothetical protein
MTQQETLVEKDVQQADQEPGPAIRSSGGSAERALQEALDVIEVYTQGNMDRQRRRRPKQ